MKSNNALIFGREVRISRTLTGSMEQVWDYLTRSELMRQWFASGDIGTTGSRVYLIHENDMAPWKQSDYMCGHVVECEAPYRLAYTIKDIIDDLPEDEVEDSFVEFSLRESGTGVIIDLTHSRLGREELAWVHAEWNARLDLLQDVLGGPADPHPRLAVRAPLAHCLLR